MTSLIFLITLLIASKATRGDGCENKYPYELDVGLYWYKIGAGLVKACATALPRLDPDKDTVIFVHGAQPHLVSSGAERFGESAEGKLLIEMWVRAGWNVGVFQWGQFADEPLANFERAESKIWTPRYFNNMRYTYLDNRTGTVAMGDASIRESVADIFVRVYKESIAPLALRDGREIRLVGHSLGTQLVTRAAYMLHATPPPGVPLPERIALLDPVFSPFRQGYLAQEACGMYLSDDLGCYIQSLTNEHEVAVEIYRSSFINRCIQSAEFNPSILRESAYAHIKLNAWGEQETGNCYHDKLWSDPKNFPKRVTALQNQVYNQHVMIIPYYMLSLLAPPHKCTHEAHGCETTASFALSAAMPTAQVLAWHNKTDDRGNKLCFHEYDNGDRSPTGPTMTIDPGDDLFYIASCEHTST